MDLGGLGETRGNPVTYNWVPPAPLYLLHIIPWIILLFTLIGKLKIDNKSWVIVIPVLFGEMTLLGIYKTVSMTNVPHYSNDIYPFFNPLILSFTIILLISDSLQKSGNWIRFIRILFILSGMGFLSLFIQKIDYPSSNGDIHIYYGIIIVGILSGFSLARYFSRKGFSGIRFAIIFLFSNLIINTILMIIHILILFAQYDIEISLKNWIFSFTFSLVLTLIPFGLLLPYLVLSLKNGFYRERLYLLLGIFGRKQKKDD